MNNTPNPLVSIIIPVYNVEKYLSRCLDSALAQTLHNIEYICVEDSSKDSSLDVLNEYAARDCRIKVFKNERNKGLSYNRNFGIAHATGKYIYFLDSDDTIEPDAMRILCDAAEKYSADVIAFGSMRVTGERKDIFVERPKEFCNTVMAGRKMFVSLMGNCGVPSPAQFYFYKLEFLREYDCTFLEGVLFEDNLFTFQMFLKCPRVMCISDILYNYYTTPGSIMQSSITLHTVASIVRITHAMTDIYKKEIFSVEENEMALKWLAIFYNDSFIRMRQYGISRLPDSIEELDENENSFYKLMRYVSLGNNYFLPESSNKIQDLKKYETVIIYGAGRIGKRFLAECIKHDVPYVIMAVSKKTSVPDKILGFDIMEIASIKCSRETAVVVIAVGVNFLDEMKETAVSLNFKNIVYYKDLFN